MMEKGSHFVNKLRIADRGSAPLGPVQVHLPCSRTHRPLSHRGLYTQKMVNFLGPCAPSTRIRSMSPVRLGPVMNEMRLG